MLEIAALLTVLILLICAVLIGPPKRPEVDESVTEWVVQVRPNEGRDPAVFAERFPMTVDDVAHYVMAHEGEIEDEVAGYAFYTCFTAIAGGHRLEPTDLITARASGHSVASNSLYFFYPDIEDGRVVGVVSADGRSRSLED